MPIASSFDAQPIYYEIHGRGEPTVVLVHGWSCNRSFWRNQVPSIAAERTAVVLDLAGHGQSGSSRERWTIRSFAKDVVAVLSELGLPPSVLVGHSMGGAVSLEAARVLKDCVVGVIGVDSLIYPTYSRMGRQAIRDVLAPFNADFRTAVIDIVGELFLPGADVGTVAWASELMASATPDMAIPSFRSLLAWDFRPASAEVDVPVVCICSAELAAEIDISRFEGLFDVRLMPNTGHFPMLEAPTALNVALGGAIRDILEGQRSRSGRPA